MPYLTRFHLGAFIAAQESKRHEKACSQVPESKAGQPKDLTALWVFVDGFPEHPQRLQGDWGGGIGLSPLQVSGGSNISGLGMFLEKSRCLLDEGRNDGVV